MDVARFLYFYRNKPLSFQQAGHSYDVFSMRIVMLVKPIYWFIQRRWRYSYKVWYSISLQSHHGFLWCDMIKRDESLWHHKLWFIISISIWQKIRIDLHETDLLIPFSCLWTSSKTNYVHLGFELKLIRFQWMTDES